MAIFGGLTPSIAALSIPTPLALRVGTLAITLRCQGELNVEVVDRDDTQKLTDWFEDRWEDRFCLDVSEPLAEIIDESWAGRSLKPYFIYLKMAYHLSQEARDGLSQYRAPASFGLLPFQEAAAQIAAHHVSKRNGVIISDVVGLGKTLVPRSQRPALLSYPQRKTLCGCRCSSIKR